ncbi:MAG TPA: hypothetical protein VFB22_00895 [Candidatus Baltobacteraceae bacterium]|nr:hypothetical protein [Candidatus Baltobacteraceae bacterium]
MDPLTGGLGPWTPIRISGPPQNPVVEWAVIGAPFAEPFFEQSAHAAMERPFNLAFARRTPFAALERLADEESGLEPDGLIFHMSRCGSTLVAQMLARLDATIVLSEAQPFEAVLRPYRLTGGDPDGALTVRRLRALAAVLGRPHRNERRLFLKLHARHVLELEMFERAFPATPWIFAFREPRAVLRSQARQPGTEVLPGTIDPPPRGVVPARDAFDADDYAAQVLAALCEAALARASSPRARFVAYESLPDGVERTILPWFGVTPNGAERERLRAIARADTKREGAFDAARDRDPVSEALDRLAARRLDDVYARLCARAAP